MADGVWIDPVRANANLRCLQPGRDSGKPEHSFVASMRQCVAFEWCAELSTLRCLPSSARPSPLSSLSGLLNPWRRNQTEMMTRTGWTLNLTAGTERAKICTPLPSSAEELDSCIGYRPGPASNSWRGVNTNVHRSTYVGFLHIDKCGGTSLRKWFRNLELNDPNWQFVSQYTDGSCFAFDPSAGVTKCARIVTQRNEVLKLVNRSMHKHVSVETCGIARRAPRPWQIIVEYHAQDSPQYSFHTGLLPTWRALAQRSPRSPRVVLTMLVREPHSWYISYIAYMRAKYGLFGRLTLEQAVASEPDGQSAKILKGWRMPWRVALPKMDLVAPLERISSYLAVLCYLMGISPPQCLAPPHENDVTREFGCVRGLSHALVNNHQSHVLRSPLTSLDQLATRCQNKSGFYEEITGSSSFRTAVKQFATGDLGMYEQVQRTFDARFIREFGKAAAPTLQRPRLAPFLWEEASPPFRSDVVRVGRPLYVSADKRHECTAHSTGDPTTWLHLATRAQEVVSNTIKRVMGRSTARSHAQFDGYPYIGNMVLVPRRNDASTS